MIIIFHRVIDEWYFQRVIDEIDIFDYILKDDLKLNNAFSLIPFQ